MSSFLFSKFEFSSASGAVISAFPLDALRIACVSEGKSSNKLCLAIFEKKSKDFDPKILSGHLEGEQEEALSSPSSPPSLVLPPQKSKAKARPSSPASFVYSSFLKSEVRAGGDDSGDHSGFLQASKSEGHTHLLEQAKSFCKIYEVLLPVKSAEGPFFVQRNYFFDFQSEKNLFFLISPLKIVGVVVNKKLLKEEEGKQEGVLEFLNLEFEDKFDFHLSGWVASNVFFLGDAENVLHFFEIKVQCLNSEERFFLGKIGRIRLNLERIDFFWCNPLSGGMLFEQKFYFSNEEKDFSQVHVFDFFHKNIKYYSCSPREVFLLNSKNELLSGSPPDIAPSYLRKTHSFLHLSAHAPLLAVKNVHCDDFRLLCLLKDASCLFVDEDLQWGATLDLLGAQPFGAGLPRTSEDLAVDSRGEWECWGAGVEELEQRGETKAEFGSRSEAREHRCHSKLNVIHFPPQPSEGQPKKMSPSARERTPESPIFLSSILESCQVIKLQDSKVTDLLFLSFESVNGVLNFFCLDRKKVIISKTKQKRQGKAPNSVVDWDVQDFCCFLPGSCGSGKGGRKLRPLAKFFFLSSSSDIASKSAESEDVFLDFHFLKSQKIKKLVGQKNVVLFASDENVFFYDGNIFLRFVIPKNNDEDEGNIKLENLKDSQKTTKKDEVQFLSILSDRYPAVGMKSGKIWIFDFLDSIKNFKRELKEPEKPSRNLVSSFSAGNPWEWAFAGSDRIEADPLDSVKKPDGTGTKGRKLEGKEVDPKKGSVLVKAENKKSQTRNDVKHMFRCSLSRVGKSRKSSSRKVGNKNLSPQSQKYPSLSIFEDCDFETETDTESAKVRDVFCKHQGINECSSPPDLAHFSAHKSNFPKYRHLFHEAPILGVFELSGLGLVSLDVQGTLKVWKGQSLELEAEIRTLEEIKAIFQKQNSHGETMVFEEYFGIVDKDEPRDNSDKCAFSCSVSLCYSGVNWVCIGTPQGKILALIIGSRRLSFSRVRVFQGHSVGSRVNFLKYSDSSSLLMSGGEDGTLALWDAPDLTGRDSLKLFEKNALVNPRRRIFFGFPVEKADFFEHEIVFLLRKQREDAENLESMSAQGTSLRGRDAPYFFEVGVWREKHENVTENPLSKLSDLLELFEEGRFEFKNLSAKGFDLSEKTFSNFESQQVSKRSLEAPSDSKLSAASLRSSKPKSKPGAHRDPFHPTCTKQSEASQSARREKERKSKKEVEFENAEEIESCHPELSPYQSSFLSPKLFSPFFTEQKPKIVEKNLKGVRRFSSGKIENFEKISICSGASYSISGQLTEHYLTEKSKTEALSHTPPPLKSRGGSPACPRTSSQLRRPEAAHPLPQAPSTPLPEVKIGHRPRTGGGYFTIPGAKNESFRVQLTEEGSRVWTPLEGGGRLKGMFDYMEAKRSKEKIALFPKSCAKKAESFLSDLSALAGCGLTLRMKSAAQKYRNRARKIQEGLQVRQKKLRELEPDLWRGWKEVGSSEFDHFLELPHTGNEGFTPAFTQAFSEDPWHISPCEDPKTEMLVIEDSSAKYAEARGQWEGEEVSGEEALSRHMGFEVGETLDGVGGSLDPLMEERPRTELSQKAKSSRQSSRGVEMDISKKLLKFPEYAKKIETFDNLSFLENNISGIQVKSPKNARPGTRNSVASHSSYSSNCSENQQVTGKRKAEEQEEVPPLLIPVNHASYDAARGFEDQTFFACRALPSTPCTEKAGVSRPKGRQGEEEVEMEKGVGTNEKAKGLAEGSANGEYQFAGEKGQISEEIDYLFQCNDAKFSDFSDVAKVLKTFSSEEKTEFLLHFFDVPKCDKFSEEEILILEKIFLDSSRKPIWALNPQNLSLKYLYKKLGGTEVFRTMQLKQEALAVFFRNLEKGSTFVRAEEKETHKSSREALSRSQVLKSRVFFPDLPKKDKNKFFSVKFQGIREPRQGQWQDGFLPRKCPFGGGGGALRKSKRLLKGAGDGEREDSARAEDLPFRVWTTEPQERERKETSVRSLLEG